MKNRKINRREAIQKSAKYAGITALSTFLILNPKTAQAFSCSSPGTVIVMGIQAIECKSQGILVVKD